MLQWNTSYTSFSSFPPASRWLLPTASRGDSSFSSFPPASRWLLPTASRGVLLSLSPLQAGGFGQLPAGGFFFLFFPPASRWLRPAASRGVLSLSPCKQVASANCQQGGSSFSSFPPASRWLLPTASRGVLLSLSPLQAGGFGQLPAGGFFLFPPASRWLRPTASRGVLLSLLSPCKQVASASCQQGGSFSFSLQAGGFGQLPAGGFFFLFFPPCKQVASANCQQGGSSFSFPPASRWLRPTASRGVLLSLSPLQAGGFGQLPAGGFFFLFFPPASRWLRPAASRGVLSLSPCKQVASANCQQGGSSFSSFPLQAGGFCQLPAGGASAGSAVKPFPPPPPPVTLKTHMPLGRVAEYVSTTPNNSSSMTIRTNGLSEATLAVIFGNLCMHKIFIAKFELIKILILNHFNETIFSISERLLIIEKQKFRQPL
ncbi:hypothetical protein ACQ4LE_002639 [Meloidogyne hapla]